MPRPELVEPDIAAAAIRPARLAALPASAPGDAGPAGTPAASARRAPRAARMIAVAVAWGSCFVLVSWGLRDAPVLWFAALRALLAGAALLAAAVLIRRPSGATLLPRDAATWLLVALLALTNVTVTFAAMFASVTGVTTGVAAVLANSQALLVVLPAWWLFGERPRIGEVVGVAVGFGGLVLVAAPAGAGRGAWLAVLAAAGVAAGALLARRLAGIDLLALGAWQFLLGGAALAVAAGVVDEPGSVLWTARFVTSLTVLALLATALPYVLWFTELRRASLTAVTAWTLLVPVVGVTLGVVVLGERVTLVQVAGDAVVLAALALVANSGRAAGRRARAAARSGTGGEQ